MIVAIGCAAYYLTQPIYIMVEFKKGTGNEDALITIAKYGGDILTQFDPNPAKPRVAEFSVSRIKGMLIFKNLQQESDVAWASHSIDSRDWWGYRIFGFLGW